MVETTGWLLLLIAVKVAISPNPLAGSPIDGLSFVQVINAPLTAVAKWMVEIVEPLQATWFTGSVTAGIGFTVIVKVFDGPGQPFNSPVIVIVAVTG